MIDLGNLTTDEQVELLRLLELQAKAKAENLLVTYKPYPKQAEFHAAGKPPVLERMLKAGNQLGKPWLAEPKPQCTSPAVTLRGGMGCAFTSPSSVFAVRNLQTSHGTAYSAF